MPPVVVPDAELVDGKLAVLLCGPADGLLEDSGAATTSLGSVETGGHKVFVGVSPAAMIQCESEHPMRAVAKVCVRR